MPIWMSDDGEEVVAVGSIAELKELSGVEVRSVDFRKIFFLMNRDDGGKSSVKRQNMPGTTHVKKNTG